MASWRGAACDVHLSRTQLQYISLYFECIRTELHLLSTSGLIYISYHTFHTVLLHDLGRI